MRGFAVWFGGVVTPPPAPPPRGGGKLGWLLLVGVLVGAGHAGAANVGFEQAQVAGPNGAMSVSIWYPTAAAATPQNLGPYAMSVAMGAPIAGAAHPLIVVSHGSGGSGLGHYDTDMALASAGFVVAAVTHPGDNYRDQSRVLWLQDRPPQIRAVLDYMLGSWHDHAAIRGDRVGMFGFSAGGFTTLVMIGGKPDYSRVAPYCASHAAVYTCALVRQRGGLPKTLPPASVWVVDPRIKAAVIAAPGLGFSFTAASLGRIAVPVQLWGAGSDQVLPVGDNVALVKAGLPGTVDYHLVPGAGHYDFLGPCSAALATAAPDICAETGGFDRAAFHRTFDAAVVGFFRRTLER